MGKKTSGLLLKESSLRKRYPDSNLASVIFIKDEDRLTLPSKFIAFNHLIGGGLRYGTIMELLGEESGGKSLLAYNFASVAQALGGVVLWDDAEASFDPRWAKKNGIDLTKLELLPDENILELVSDWMADMCIYYRSKLINNEPILLVADSIATWETQTNMDTADTDSGEDMGRRAKMIYKVIRKRVKIFAKYGICVLFINQIRNRPVKSKYEDPETSPGGLAMRYYASIRASVRRSKSIIDAKKRKVGQEVYIKVKKNKIADPKDPIRGKVYFKEHDGCFAYDNYAGLAEALVETGVVKRKQARFYYKKESIAHGDLAFEKLLRTDDKLRKELIGKSGILTVGKARAMITAATENRYPVKMKAQAIEKDSKEDDES